MQNQKTFPSRENGGKVEDVISGIIISDIDWVSEVGDFHHRPTMAISVSGCFTEISLLKFHLLFELDHDLIISNTGRHQENYEEMALTCSSVENHSSMSAARDQQRTHPVNTKRAGIAVSAVSFPYIER